MYTKINPNKFEVGNSILFISQSELHGGAEEMLIYYLIAARETGYSPVLVLPKQGWVTEQCRSSNIPFEIVPTIPQPFTYNKIAHLRTWLWNAIQIARLAKKWNALFIHSNSTRAAFHGGLGARFAGIPSICHIHDVIKSPYSSHLFAYILKNLVDETICVSNFVKQDVLRDAPFLQGKIRTIYNGLLDENAAITAAFQVRKDWCIQPEDILFGVIATMVRAKGQDQLIKAFMKVNKSNPHTRLMIVGGSQDIPEQIVFENELKKLVTENGLQGQVIFTGWKENVNDYLQCFDIFSFTPNQPDSLPTVLIHACARGKPIISTWVGGISEIIKDQQSGILVEPNNIEQLEDAMVVLINDAQKRTQMGIMAEAQYHKLFTFDKMKEKLKECYEQILFNAS